MAPELDRPRCCLVSYYEGTLIEEREYNRGCRGGGRQVEGVAGKVRSDNAGAGRLIYRENVAGSDTRTVCYSATALRRGTRS